LSTPAETKSGSSKKDKSSFKAHPIDINLIRGLDKESDIIDGLNAKQADDIRLNILATVIQLLDSSLHVYRKEVAVVEVFNMAKERLVTLEQAKWIPASLRVRVSS